MDRLVKEAHKITSGQYEQRGRVQTQHQIFQASQHTYTKKIKRRHKEEYAKKKTK
jgi:hypothetical protein